MNILLGDIEEDSCRAGEGPEGLPREPEAGGEAAQARGRAAAQGPAERGAQGAQGAARPGTSNQGKAQT